MMELSFGEQIKILLKRKNMSIQELALLYEQQTGKKMSRQNLTQRLKRDNFPEQDMHMLAALLGYSVSIQLNPAAVTLPLPEFMRTETAIPQPPVLQSAAAPTQAASIPTLEVPVIEELAPDLSREAVPDKKAAPEHPAKQDDSQDHGMTFQIPDAFRKVQPQGDINPMTGEEYLTNTVRRHPEIEEYLQVYDQTTHEWSDVREDYFWEFQESKKKMLGKDYQEPILI